MIEYFRGGMKSKIGGKIEQGKGEEEGGKREGEGTREWAIEGETRSWYT